MNCKPTFLVLCCISLCIPSTSSAGQVEVEVDEESGMKVYRLSQKQTVVLFAPSAGANAFSIQVDQIEYLRQPETLKDLPGVGYGNPVLYPTPNRVKSAQFTFENQTVKFTANAGKNFIHGLVNRHAWKVVGTQAHPNSASVRCVASFSADEKLGKLFPFPHQVFLSVTVTDQSVRWEYEVDNTTSNRSVPFGFALHPYIKYQGQRKETYLTIPASHWMQSDQQLPSGELVAASDLDFPLGKPMSLHGAKFDDVFWGMKPVSKTLIDFRDVNRSITISASADFTHLVVWTPDQPYFGIESQTCSTDAHNLHANGKTKAAHLQICPPGKKMGGWVKYSFAQQP